MDKDKPAPALGFLKSYIEQNGFSVKTIDGNQIEELHVAHAQRILDAEDLVVKVSEDNAEKVSDISKGQSKFNVGNFFEDFYMDQIIEHATPRTITAGDSALYTALYGSRFALHSSKEFAKNINYHDSPVDDFLLFNAILHCKIKSFYIAKSSHFT